MSVEPRVVKWSLENVIMDGLLDNSDSKVARTRRGLFLARRARASPRLVLE